MDVANGAHQTLIELFRSRHEVLFILKPGQLTSGKKTNRLGSFRHLLVPGFNCPEKY
jgi:hypothetical protein